MRQKRLRGGRSPPAWRAKGGGTRPGAFRGERERNVARWDSTCPKKGETMNGKMWSRVLGLMLVIGLLGWIGVAATAVGEKLLFVYSPGCTHCAYQQPIIKEFASKHPEIEVTWVKYDDMGPEEKELIKGTSGHPVMVFYGGTVVHRVVGETRLVQLEKEYSAFKVQVRKAAQAKKATPTTPGETTTSGSGIVCY